MALRQTFNVPLNQNNAKLDGLYAKALASFVKMKVRKGQASIVPRLLSGHKV